MRQQVNPCIRELDKIWVRGRRKPWGKREGVLKMIHEDIYVEGVQYRDSMAEVIRITIRTNEKERRKIISIYAPSRTIIWKLKEHKVIQKEVLKCLDNMIRKDKKVQLVGGFNCKDVNWKEMVRKWKCSEDMLKHNGSMGGGTYKA